MKAHIDLETACDLVLPEVGAKRYFDHPSFRVLLTAIQVGDGPVNVWEGVPDFRDFEYVAEWHAFNAPFEMRGLTRQGVSIPREKWRCAQAHAYARGFSGRLADVGKQMGLPPGERKLEGGKRLIDRFSLPTHPSGGYWTKDTSPMDWEKFVKYNRHDVIAERAVSDFLSLWPMTSAELDLMRWDWEVNERGLPIDEEFVWEAQNLVEKYEAEGLEVLGRLTGLPNPNSRDQILRWVRDRGANLPDLQAGTIRDWLEGGDLSSDVRVVLVLRLAVSQAASKKYVALENRLHKGRFHDGYVYCGAARTGRWSHRTYQPGNLKRPDRDSSPEILATAVKNGTFDALYGGSLRELELLGSAVRGAVHAAPGKRLVVSDLSNIESRVLGYLARCEKINALHAADQDPYKVFAEDWLKIPYDQVDKKTRNQCKPPDLGCGYRLGGNGLVAYAAGMGQTLDPDSAEEAVKAWRRTRWEVPVFWRVCELAAREALAESPHPFDELALDAAYAARGAPGALGKAGDLLRYWLPRFKREGLFLVVELPSGRKLHYFRPEWKQVKAPWGDLVWNLVYWGQDSKTHQWCRITSHGGKTVEQLCQATARDVLVCGMLQYSLHGGNIVGHLHDEVIAEEDERWPGHMLGVLNDCLTTRIPWAPDLVLKAEGYTAGRFRKG